MPSQDQSKPARARSVFINCPFDADYQPLLRAICFTLLACGYRPRCALDFSDSGAVRFAEIVRMITQCDLSVHDISRVELDRDSQLPRFNMPLELGADLGLRLEGPARQRERKILILDVESHRYDKTLSDISGMDIEAHGGQVRKVIKSVRDWLAANQADGAALIPGAAAISADHDAYLKIAPDIARRTAARSPRRHAACRLPARGRIRLAADRDRPRRTVTSEARSRLRAQGWRLYCAAFRIGRAVDERRQCAGRDHYGQPIRLADAEGRGRQPRRLGRGVGGQGRVGAPHAGPPVQFRQGR